MADHGGPPVTTTIEDLATWAQTIKGGLGSEFSLLTQLAPRIADLNGCPVIKALFADLQVAHATLHYQCSDGLDAFCDYANVERSDMLREGEVQPQSGGGDKPARPL